MNVNTFNSRSNCFILNNINTTCVVLPICCWFTSVEFYDCHLFPDSLIFLDRLVHASNLSISIVRFHNWLNIYFPSDRNNNDSVKNTWTYRHLLIIPAWSASWCHSRKFLVVLSHAGTECAEYIHIIITSTQEADNVIPTSDRWIPYGLE